MGLKRKVVVDGFAGGGGASEGIRLALGRSPDYGYNHDVVALAMHCVNHPETRHFSASIWKVDPDEIEGDIGLMWASPDCKHFSRAKGGKPVERNVRDLAWVVVRWARRRAGGPEVIILENVLEFMTWGPLDKDGYPDKDRHGATFKRWVRDLRNLGYVVDWRAIVAADKGAPTIRKRLFVIARRDGRRIVWPRDQFAKPAIIKGGLKPWRTAAEHVIDWSLPCPSIFDSAEEIREKFGVRAIRPLVDNTMARIARGVFKFVINHPAPFIIPITHTQDGARGHSVHHPLPTITAAHRGELALVTPFLSRQFGASVGSSVIEPAPTIMPGGGGKTAVVTPFLAGVGSRAGQSPERGVVSPFGTVTATKRGMHALIAPTLIQTGYGERQGQAPRTLDLFNPLGTTVAGGAKHALVAAFLAQHNGREIGRDAREPPAAVVRRGPTQAMVSAGLLNLHGDDRRWIGPREPVPGLCAGGTHAAEVRAFLLKYHETGGQHQDLRDPLHTVDTRDRFGLVIVWIGGEPYAIVDIGMRMLVPRELFLANGFRRDYIIDHGVLADWRRDDAGVWTQRAPQRIAINKTDQIRMCGNSVPPPVAEDLVRANCPYLIEHHEAAE